MMHWYDSPWRHTVLRVGTVWCLVAAFGCRSDLAVWQAKLAASNASRIAGVWEAQFYRDGQATNSLRPSQVVGQIALTLNEERLGAPGFGEPPMVVGTYNVDFAQVGLGAGIYTGFPDIVGRTRGDSVDFKFAVKSKLPIDLRGVIAGDSIMGRWDAHSRAGLDGAGDFVLRRR